MPAPHDRQQLADLAAGGPVDQADPSAGPADACELTGDDLVARRELHAERRQHDVEVVVVEREILGVALDPVDDHVALGGAPAGGLEQLRRQIDADDLRAGGGRPDRDVPGAGRDVEHLLPRHQPDLVQQTHRARRDRARARTPWPKTYADGTEAVRGVSLRLAAGEPTGCSGPTGPASPRR